jgi:ADP-ribose pyrophosphatase YjhB (NUDIX family)
VAQPGEDLSAAAAREVLTETGWEPADLRPLIQLQALALTLALDDDRTDHRNHL